MCTWRMTIAPSFLHQDCQIKQINQTPLRSVPSMAKQLSSSFSNNHVNITFAINRMSPLHDSRIPSILGLFPLTAKTTSGRHGSLGESLPADTMLAHKKHQKLNTYTWHGLISLKLLTPRLIHNAGQFDDVEAATYLLTAQMRTSFLF